MSLRERKKLATRNALIKTARRMFAEKGYENTTLEEICEEVQVHVTTFFSYFESKEELAFARTLEMLESFRTLMRDPPEGVDIITVWWTFLYDYGLRARGEEHTLMVRLENVPALRNRYASIVRQYEEELAAALAKESGADPATDLYSHLLSSTLLAAIVSGARWHALAFGADAENADTAVFAKLILSRFPTRAEVESEQRRITQSNAARPAPSRRRASAAAVSRDDPDHV
jgi:AcrR family transcriptional regulator